MSTANTVEKDYVTMIKYITKGPIKMHEDNCKQNPKPKEKIVKKPAVQKKVVKKPTEKPKSKENLKYYVKCITHKAVN